MPSQATGLPLAVKLRGFGPLGILGIVVVVALGPILEPFGMLAAVLWVQLSETPWRELGFVRPKSWFATIAIGVVFGAVFKIAMKSSVMPLFGAPDVNPYYHYLAGNTAAMMNMMFVSIFGAGFGEELVFRGFLFERFGKLFGTGVGAKIRIVLLTSAVFGAIHYFAQGVMGVEQALITGLVFGTIFAITGRIVMIMIAHAVFDVTAVLMIYLNLEQRVAHLVFK